MTNPNGIIITGIGARNLQKTNHDVYNDQPEESKSSNGDMTGGLIAIMMLSMMLPLLQSLTANTGTGSGGGSTSTPVLPTPKGYIYITSVPTGASVYVDDANMNTVTPCTIQTSPGNHSVSLKLAGYDDLTMVVMAIENETVNFNAILVQAIYYGTLDVSSVPTGAMIYVDGSLTGQATPCTLEMVTGSHVITAKLSGYTDASVTVTIAQGENTPISINMAVSTGKGSVSMISNPISNIWVAGQNAYKQTPATMTVNPGTYYIALQLTGYYDYVEEVVVEADVTKTINVVLEFITSQAYTTPDGHAFKTYAAYQDYCLKNFIPINVNWG